MEQIYTIPVNEAFDEAIEKEGYHCPLCALYEKQEEMELELILGASMMEPDVRIRTNEQGFCGTHYDKMFLRKNRLSLALMMESHLAELEKNLKAGALDGLLGQAGKKQESRIEKKASQCYLCGRIEFQFSRMIHTVAFLFGETEDFRRKMGKLRMLCLPHTARLLQAGRQELGKKAYAAFYEAVWGCTSSYLKKLGGDVSFFCKKFDYRYENEPWGESKDAVERTIRFLTGSER